MRISFVPCRHKPMLLFRLRSIFRLELTGKNF